MIIITAKREIGLPDADKIADTLNESKSLKAHNILNTVQMF